MNGWMDMLETMRREGIRARTNIVAAGNKESDATDSEFSGDEVAQKENVNEPPTTAVFVKSIDLKDLNRRRIEWNDK
jgi:hypothetical protein